MEPTYIVETMGLQWTSELTFAENVPALIKQFKKARGLKPFKVVVYGPPIVGKTTLSKLICEAYGLVYVSPETVAQDILEDLAWRVSHWETGETAGLGMSIGEEEEPIAGDDDEDLGDEEGVQEAARNTIAVLRSGRLITEDDVQGYLRQRLLSREAVNRGWVLDGFPTTMGQCGLLFDRGEEQDSEAGEETQEEPFDEDIDLYSNVLKKMLPDIVVSLDATDDFICEKAMRQPEGDSRQDEEVVLKRLSEFRSGDARDITPLNFFDELDIHPLVVPVKEHLDYGMKQSYAAVTLRMGRPCRYGKLMALIEAAEKKEKYDLETLRTQEAKALKDRSCMRYFARRKRRRWRRPAEYLFKLNPSGKMLEPGYNLQAEKLLGKIKILDDALNDLDIKIDPPIPAEAEIDQATSSKLQMSSMSAL
ncbi:Adenylate kinase 7 [Operophtera brumata]|uniref:Adenylate kinase 7 n=1 Tax=Operophtera brumata TaxID=104452 RepID=A0A0L7LGD2_OPEBR|nr:Adenylate kinase 7 [Operophtera brumata]